MTRRPRVRYGSVVLSRRAGRCRPRTCPPGPRRRRRRVVPRLAALAARARPAGRRSSPRVVTAGRPRAGGAKPQYVDFGSPLSLLALGRFGTRGPGGAAGDAARPRTAPPTPPRAPRRRVRRRDLSERPAPEQETDDRPGPARCRSDTAGDWQAFTSSTRRARSRCCCDCVAPLVDELSARRPARRPLLHQLLAGGSPCPAAAAAVPRRRRAGGPAPGRGRRSTVPAHAGPRSTRWRRLPGELYNTLFALEFPEAERPPTLIGADGRMRLAAEQLLRVRALRARVRQVRRPGRRRAGRMALPSTPATWSSTRSALNLHLRTVAARPLRAADDGDGRLLPARPGRWRVPRPLPRVLARRVRRHELRRHRRVRARRTRPWRRSWRRRFGTVRSALAAGEPGRAAGFLRRWAEHCRELRDRVRELAGAASWPSAPRDGAGTSASPTRRRRCRCCSPYLHMTNNRLP